MNVETLYDLFVFELQEAYQIETELADALDAIVDEAGINSLDGIADDEIRDTLTTVLSEHQEETREHVERLEGVFEAAGRRPDTGQSTALRGLLDRKERFDNIVLNDALRPFFYVNLGRDVERLEIRTYESLIENARALDLPEEVVEALEANLDDEREAAERFEELSDREELRTLREELGEQSPEI